MPVPLFSDAGERFVLLNGTRGSFCLDVSDNDFTEDARSLAWSSNVGHYVAIEGGQGQRRVLVQRWDSSRFLPEQYDYERVVKDLDSFHRHLEKDSPPSDASVVTHALQVFRSLRVALGPDYGGQEALSAFLYLLAAARDGVARSAIDTQLWALPEEGQGVASEIGSGEWEGLVQELMRGRPIEKLEPKLDLVLRHAAGSLFQEAHYSALLGARNQLLLEGFAPSPAKISRRTEATGLHFTPPAIARSLVEEAIVALGDRLPNSVTAFDPACGSGEFLRELVRQLELRDYRGSVRLIGWDVSAAACAMARFVLAWELRGNHGFDVDVQVTKADSLSSSSWPTGVDLVLMNPPFASWREMTAAQKEVTLTVLGDKARQRPDLSTAFLWRALSSVADGGVLATVLPASFLDGTSFPAVREAVGSELSPRLIARLGSHDLFPQARVDAALYVGRRGAAESPPLAFWADHRSTSVSAGLRVLRRLRSSDQDVRASTPVDRDQDGFSIYATDQVGRGSGSWAPRPYKKWKLLQSLPDEPRVGDLFDVKQGAITGLNRVLIVPASEWLELPESERDFFRPAILNESIQSGKVEVTGYVFYPYGDASIADEATLVKRLPEFYHSRLEPNKEALLARKRIDPSSWWVLSEHRAWQVTPLPKLMSTYFGDVGSFAWDEAGNAVVVQGYAWLPRKRKKFGRRLGLAYLAILNTDVFSAMLAASSNHVGGGQWNLSKRFVEKAPLPSLWDVDPEILIELSQLGEAIQAEGLASLSTDERDHLEQVSQTAFGVPAAL